MLCWDNSMPCTLWLCNAFSALVNRCPPSVCSERCTASKTQVRNKITLGSTHKPHIVEKRAVHQLKGLLVNEAVDVRDARFARCAISGMFRHVNVNIVFSWSSDCNVHCFDRQVFFSNMVCTCTRISCSHIHVWGCSTANHKV